MKLLLSQPISLQNINDSSYLQVLPSLLAARIQLIDITPEEAQQYITQQSLDLRYAKLLSSGLLGAGVRGHGGVLPYFNGHEIEDPNDYVEEIYDANQFHGQVILTFFH